MRTTFVPFFFENPDPPGAAEALPGLPGPESAKNPFVSSETDEPKILPACSLTQVNRKRETDFHHIQAVSGNVHEVQGGALWTN
jgi:hypothetical protein